ncbi:hypothetical protein ABE66_06330 [Cytobacillus firmus]|nr:hypothetical protein [Cytobacillus firmus]
MQNFVLYLQILHLYQPRALPRFLYLQEAGSYLQFSGSICAKSPSICRITHLFATFPTQFAKFTIDKIRLVPITKGRGDKSYSIVHLMETRIDPNPVKDLFRLDEVPFAIAAKSAF